MMRKAKSYRVLKDFWLNGELQSSGTVVSLTPRDARAFFSAGQISEVVETDHLTDNCEAEPLDVSETDPKRRGKRR